MIKFIFCFDGFPYVFAPVFSTPAFSTPAFSAPPIVHKTLLLISVCAVLSRFCQKQTDCNCIHCLRSSSAFKQIDICQFWSLCVPTCFLSNVFHQSSCLLSFKIPFLAARRMSMALSFAVVLKLCR